MEWQPEKTWIFAVGLLEWEDEESFPSFPEAENGRFDLQLVNFFQESGIPEEQIVYLQDQEATLAAIQERFPEFLSKTEADHLLIVYFTGHGCWDKETGEHYFVNYDAVSDEWDTYWSVTSIFDEIENSFEGYQALLMADCCASGGLIDAAKQRDSEISYACVSSVYSHYTSTGAWTFTEALLKGLQGNSVVDLDEDGVITLYDFARYAELEVAFIEEQKSVFVTTNDFDPQMQLAIVTEAAVPDVGKRVMVEYEEEQYKAKILEVNESGEFLVKYMIDGSQEWVTKDRIYPYKPEMMEIGTDVEVLDENEEWLPAIVKKSWYVLHLISYNDYSELWDEWVNSDRIRFPNE